MPTSMYRSEQRARHCCSLDPRDDPGFATHFSKHLSLTVCAPAGQGVHTGAPRGPACEAATMRPVSFPAAPFTEETSC